MEQEQRLQLKKYLDLFARRKKIVLSFVLAALFVGLGLYLVMPKVYESTAMLMYEEAKINPVNKLSPEAQAKTQEMVATLTQQVESRTSLEAIIKQFDLYQKMRQQLPMEDVIDQMRKGAIKIIQSSGQGAVFKVSFDGAEPKKVMQVTNALAARFVEENLRYREERATETSAYVGDELKLAKEEMDKKDALMRDYKLKYYNEMPQQFTANSERLTALQDQMQKNRDSAQGLERTKVLIQEQITLRKEALAGQLAGLGLPALGTKGMGGSALPAPVSELAQARQQLADLKLRYTEDHPEVKRLENKVAALERSAAAQDKKTTVGAGGGSEAQSPGQLHDSQLEQLVMQLKKADLDIATLNQDNEALKKQVDQYQKWLGMTPVREAEWNALTRDYQQLKAHYDQLVSQNLQAGSAESLERRQKGSQFKIVDSAYLPEKPVKPDFKKVMLGALFAGLALGGGLVALLEVQDSSFRDVSELEAVLGLPVICAISRIRNELDLRRERRRAMIWWTILALALLVLLAALAYLYKTGRIIV
ncbi:MAG: Wzz/FepE/Etk N-terminal domain-containing protein [Desulfobacteraceae bacterium]|nr:Wzz/FepE/Etk N-terminal domain-containing protein [Desulfobacteraceae bacterium]